MPVLKLKNDEFVSRDAFTDLIETIVSDAVPRQGREHFCEKLKAAALKAFDKGKTTALVLTADTGANGEPFRPRLLYKDKHHDAKLAKARPVAFLQAIWGDYLKEHTLYQHELARIDEPLLKALRNWSNTHDGFDLNDVVKPRGQLTQKRVSLQVMPVDATAQRALRKIQTAAPALAAGTSPR